MILASKKCDSNEEKRDQDRSEVGFIHEMKSETESGSPEGSPENCLNNRTRIMLIYASDDDDIEEEERGGLSRLENGGFRGTNRGV